MQSAPRESNGFVDHTTEVALFDLSDEQLDRYPSGVITLRRDGTILRYNRAERETDVCYVTSLDDLDERR